MNILYLELSAKELTVQRDFYADVLELPVELDSSMLKVRAGNTDLTFTQAPTEFDDAYHFAFNISENQFDSAKKWIASRVSLLRDESRQDEFESKSWNSHSVYFKD